jgi:hypothetical protein
MGALKLNANASNQVAVNKSNAAAAANPVYKESQEVAQGYSMSSLAGGGNPVFQPKPGDFGYNPPDPNANKPGYHYDPVYHKWTQDKSKLFGG